MRTTVTLLLLAAAVHAARISISRGKKDSKIDELCARMHNNTAIEGADPLMMLQATAYECQKRCVDMYPTCSAVVYYYLHNETKHHYCYLFEKNSVSEKIELVEQKADNQKDLVRMLEIVTTCHTFDAFPPLLEDGHASSTDKVDRKKRQNGDESMNAGDWTDWAPCTKGGFEVRSQSCDYGRKIQRRGCAARQYPQRQPAPPAPQPHLAPVIQTPYPQDPRQQQTGGDPRYAQAGQQGSVDPRQDPRLAGRQDPRQDPRLGQQDPRLGQQDPRLAGHAQPDPRQDPRLQQQGQQVGMHGGVPHAGQSPLDAQAQAYQQRMAHYRENQRHPAQPHAVPCTTGGICEEPRFQPPRDQGHGFQQMTQTHGFPPQTQVHQLRPQIQVPQPQPPTYVPAPHVAPTRYRPAPPPPPVCNGAGCEAPQQQAGQWHEWSDWSECSCTCGDGLKQRRRECATNNCQGPELEQAPCNMGPCETWSEWCEWSTCSGSCGQGVKTRTRFCHLGTQRCEGSDFETAVCDAGPCPEWSQWEDWSSCSASCGPGVAQRQRTCLGGIHGDQACPGPRTEERACEYAPCSTWADWSDWGQCSASCGEGMKRRMRVCQHGTDCPGPAEETQFCYGPPCAAWTEWCEWSGCSAKCGPGQRTRTRACLAGDGKESRDCQGLSVETTLCEGNNCCRWSDWCHWSMCDKECGGGQSIRTRTCMRDGGGADDSCHCDGSDREERECNTQSCSPQCSWTQWCDWSDCSTPSACEVGVQARSRQCVGELGCHCFGPAEESQQCRGKTPCPQAPPC